MKRKADSLDFTQEDDSLENENDDAKKVSHKRPRLEASGSRGKKSTADNYRFDDSDDEDEGHNIDDDMNDRQERRRVLKEVWNDVAGLLRKLEVYIQDRKINTKPWDNDEYVKMFTKIYDLCTLPDCTYFETQLYKHYSRYLKDFLFDRVLPLLKDKNNEDMLNEIVHIWRNFRDVFVKFCSKLFSYLDRFYVTTASKNSLRSEGHRLFKENVFDNLKVQLRQIVLNKIQEDRKQIGASTVNRSLLKETLLMFLDMGNYLDDDPLKHDEIDVYVEEFEEYAATDTKNFYHTLSELWLSESSFTEYMVKAEIKIKEESQRLANIFISSSQQKLMKIIDDQLLAKNQRRLLDMSGSGVDVLIRDEKLEDLSRLFRLMSRISQGLDPIAQMFQDYISRVGRDIFKKHADEAAQKKDYTSFLHFLLESYVVELIQFHNKMDTLVTGPFQNDATFHKALSNGFKSFVNLGFRKPKKGSEEKGPEVKTSQLFAYYCDEILRKRKVESLDDALEKVVSFVQFFSDKDIFIEEYRKQLAKRLLVSGYQDSEERTMIGKLKWFYRGVGDLYKLEKMLTDKSVAVDMKQEFNQFLEKRDPNEPTVHFDLMVTVLTMGTWPINLKDTLKVLPVFANAQQVFKEFYDTKHNRRILHWAYGRSTVQLEANFSKKKVLETSTYQACVLLLFNDMPELSVKQIMSETGLDLDVVKRTLVSVSSKKFHILQIKQTSDGDAVMSEETSVGDQAPKVDKLVVANAEDVNESTLLEVNQDFHHKQTKIKLPAPRVTEEEVKKTIVNVSNDRVWTLEATIVRVMKTRKTMKLQQLIQEVITQIKDRFQPDLRNIKTRVESLIERDYIKRAENDPSTLEYVA